MNTLKVIVLLVMIQVLYCTNTRVYANIPSCRGKLVFDSSRLQEAIFVYTLVKLYTKATVNPSSCFHHCKNLFDYGLYLTLRTHFPLPQRWIQIRGSGWG